ncbi:pilin [Patescibacteria group bacterium]
MSKLTKSLFWVKNIAFICVGWLVPMAASAQSKILEKGGTDLYIVNETNLGSTSPTQIFITIEVGFLGIISLFAVAYTIYGGFLWMTSRGNEETIDKAKRVLRGSIIGIGILLAAWGVTLYAIGILGGVTGTVQPTAT